MGESGAVPAVDNLTERIAKMELQVLAAFGELADGEVSPGTGPCADQLEGKPTRRQNLPQDDRPGCHDSYRIPLYRQVAEELAAERGAVERGASERDRA
jgi:hypothetical protein